MTQYLLNATAIWLISLLLFDALLRKESFHNYNRGYLLATLTLGIALPLWHWLPQSNTYYASYSGPVMQVIAAKQSMVNATITGINGSSTKWLMIVYCTGVIISATVLAIDICRLMVLYRKGKKSKRDNWTIIETGKEQTPFSCLNLLFVCSTDQYSSSEWQMISAHEQQHTRLFHFADLLLLQLCRIAFWFHPLIYIYSRRLLLVHEYQADQPAAKSPKAYGSFLIAQALLQSAPSVTHSLNHSPIKKRIIMLTYKSTKTSKTKMLVLLPLLTVSVACFSGSSIAQQVQSAKSSASDIFSYVEQMPVTGYDIGKFIGDNIHYPDSARAHNVQGRVIIKFVVKQDGNVSDAEVIRGIGEGCDEEALRVVKMMPPWKPGKQNGKPVSVYYTLPIAFKLQ